MPKPGRPSTLRDTAGRTGLEPANWQDSRGFGTEEAARVDASVRSGAFDLDFLFPSTACNLGAPTFAGGAFFIDADGDSSCDPANDFVFAWGATGGPAGT
jgi:hypothetical protein